MLSCTIFELIVKNNCRSVSWYTSNVCKNFNVISELRTILEIFPISSESFNTRSNQKLQKINVFQCWEKRLLWYLRASRRPYLESVTVRNYRFWKFRMILFLKISESLRRASGIVGNYEVIKSNRHPFMSIFDWMGLVKFRALIFELQRSQYLSNTQIDSHYQKLAKVPESRKFSKI